MKAFYNDIDKYAAQWLRNLTKAGHITPGHIEEMSIEKIQSTQLAGFRRVHFFAGIGGWDHALHLAGWPADAEVWTGSCPCQPFSAAGRHKGTDDERHLWPAFRELIAQSLPPIVFGEQVASSDGREWLSGVRSDMEALGYEFGAADLCAAGLGAPHIRQRLWWVAIRPGVVLDHAKRIGRGAGRNSDAEHDGHELDPAGELSGPTSVGQAHAGRGEHLGRHALREAIDSFEGAPGPGEGSGAEGQRPQPHAPDDRAGDTPGGDQGHGSSVGQADAKGGGRGRGSAGHKAAQEQAPSGRRQEKGRGRHDAADGSEIDGTRPRVGLADTGRQQCEGRISGRSKKSGSPKGRASGQFAGRGQDGGVALGDANGQGLAERKRQQGVLGKETGSSSRKESERSGHGSVALGDTAGEQARLPRQPWGQSDTVACADGKTRRIEPGTFPLAHGVPARVGRLRAYGNAIVPEVAAEFIKAVMPYIFGPAK